MLVKVVGIRFRTAGKIYFFDPQQLQVKRGDHVIVETARGIEFGTAVSDIREIEEEGNVNPHKPILRLATERDIAQAQENKRKEKEAFKICLEKIRKHELEMKLIDAEYTFDNNKVLFYFTADGRIDFRELVKDLASVFKTRIELRQIGVRDETKILGGIGICGRPLCCHTHLSDFIPVSIKMAKEQNLSLNPAKISGVCGRLMCCLKHEEDTYEELNKRLPGIGDTVTTADGLRGEVQSVNVLRQRVKVLIEVNDEKEIHEYEVDQLRFKRKHGRKEQENLSEEELKELALLEKEEQEETEEKEASRGEHQNRSENGGGRERRDRQRNHRPDRDRQNGSGEEQREGRRENRGENRRENRRDGGNRTEGRENRGEGRENRGDGREYRNENRGEGRENHRENRGDGNNRGNRRGNRNYDRRNHGDRKRPEADGNNGNRE